jgi:hypothetical protein
MYVHIYVYTNMHMFIYMYFYIFTVISRGFGSEYPDDYNPNENTDSGRGNSNPYPDASDDLYGGENGDTSQQKVFLHVYLCEYMYIYMYIYMHTFLYKYTHMNIFMYKNRNVLIVGIYVYTYILYSSNAHIHICI